MGNSNRLKLLSHVSLFNYLFLSFFNCSNLLDPNDANNYETVAKLNNYAAQETSQLSVDILSHSKNSTSNIVYSPYSITSALTLLYEGARLKTGEEMRLALHLSSDKDTLRHDFDIVDSMLNSNNQYASLVTANSIWLQNSLSIDSDFTLLAKNIYGCNIGFLDFASNPDSAAYLINAWTANKTNSFIMDVVRPESISPLTNVILINALYLKADWYAPFDSAKTADEPFYVQPSGSVTVKMMRHDWEFNYFDANDCQLLELPCFGCPLSMVVILPKTSALTNFIAALSSNKLSSLQKAMTSARVQVSLPRFKIENSINLNPVLNEFGMNEAFSQNADFTGISSQGGIWVDAILHKAFININEVGIKAAATTDVRLIGSSPNPPEPKVFNANHPFIFLVKDCRSETILFMGQVINPSW